MCWLISVSAANFQGNIKDVFGQQGLVATRNANPSVLSMFSGAGPVFDVTFGGCSCDICSAGRAPFDGAAERARLVRKGWSAAKTERAIQNLQHAYDQAKRRSTKWTPFMQAVANIVGAGGKVAMLAHFYAGKFAEEEVHVSGSAKVPLADLQASFEVLREDMLGLVV